MKKFEKSPERVTVPSELLHSSSAFLYYLLFSTGLFYSGFHLRQYMHIVLFINLYNNIKIHYISFHMSSIQPVVHWWSM